MSKKWFPICFAILISSAAFSAPTSLDDCQSSGGIDGNLKDIAAATAGAFGGKTDNCEAPNDLQIDEFCTQTALRKRITDEDGFQTFLYKSTLKSFACATNDEESIAVLKIQKMWAKNWPRMKCNVPGYNLEGNNILKYAVRTTFSDFLYNLINSYNIDVNQKDPEDQKTILEFCEEEVQAKKKEVPLNSQKVKEVEDICSMLKKPKRSNK